MVEFSPLPSPPLPSSHFRHTLTVMTLRLYVAGCWKEREAISKVMRTLEGLGHTITHDWTKHEPTYTDFYEQNRSCALDDIRGVCQADIVIVLLTLPDYAYRGTSSEIGAALAAREIRGTDRAPSLWIVAPADPRATPPSALPYCLTSCFMHTADEYFSSVDDVVARLAAK